MNPNPNPPPTVAPAVPPDWTPLGDGHLPAPTFWPAGFALGVTFIFWGLITSWVVLLSGVVVFAVTLAGWIAEIRHERNVPHT